MLASTKDMLRTGATTALLAGAMILAGCGTPGGGEAPSGQERPATEQRHTGAGAEAVEDVTAGTDASASDAERQSDEHGSPVGMANPWQDSGSAQGAAKDAGMDSFVIPDGYEAGELGRLEHPQFRSTRGIAEATYHVNGGDLVVRKGIGVFAEGETHDLSGDYTEQPVEWRADNLGIELRCWGPEDGKARRAIWDSGEVSYSVLLVPGNGGTATISKGDLLPLVLEIF